MKLRATIKRLFMRNKSKDARQPDLDAEQARELERLIASGTAANKFPPR